jgi:hypothetical protein
MPKSWLTPTDSLSRMGTQKCEQIFTVAREAGLLEAVTPVCKQARRTIVRPVLRGSVLAPLRMDQPTYEAQSLMEAVSRGGEEDDVDVEMEAVSRGGEEDDADVEMEDPQAFELIDQDELMGDEEFRGFIDNAPVEGAKDTESTESESAESESAESESEESAESAESEESNSH